MFNKNRSTTSGPRKFGGAPKRFSGSGSSSSFKSGSRTSFGSGSNSRDSFSSSAGSSFGTRPRTGSSGFSGRGSSSSFSSRGSSFGGRGGFGGGSRGGFGGGRSGGNRGGGQRRRGEFIDASKFVRKVADITTEAPVAITHQFADFQIDARLKETILKKGYTTPTPIQDRAIPEVLKGHDVLGLASTGTGKTGAFLIPLVHKIINNPKEQVMIIVPTRELAIQIDDELKGFTRGMKIFSVVTVGGMNIGKQISQLKYQYNFIIGTPGRIKDLIDRKMIHLDEFATVVLDEADRMLDMGFIHDMRFVMEGMPKPRHTLLFSATLSPTIEKLTSEFLNNPVRISVKTSDTSKNVDQDVVHYSHKDDKFDTLHTLLKGEDFQKVIVFGSTKHGVEKLSEMLSKNGIPAESIHGNKNHSQRQRALGKFKDNRSKVLVATDVAARGLDIPNVSHVINYDIPETYDDYVHRIGRTGRGNKLGKALTFVEKRNTSR